MGNTDLDAIPRVPCHPQNQGGSRDPGQIRYLVYHYTGNDGDTATANANYYRNTVVQASAHYFVDDDSVICSVEPSRVAWAVGGKKWSDCAGTGGGTLYGVVTNGNSVSIEMCGTRHDGTRMASEATLARAAALGRALMERYHIPAQRVVRHFDVTGKHCPAYMMDAAAWAAFKERLEEEEMKLYHYVSELPYGKEAVTRAIRSGHIKLDASGAMGLWECNLQAVILMDRAGLFDTPAAPGR